MSSSKPKKVHYSSSAKGSKSSGHRHKDSRDSGVGSSSASDRASLGTSPNESPFNSQEIYTQRHNPSALNEALNAANEEIRMLKAEKAQLEDLLAESNKENRALKKERKELEEDIEDLRDDLDQEKKINERLRSGRPSPSNSNTVANSSAPRRTEPPLTNPRPSSRRFSTSTSGAPPLAPQPPPNNTPNPFTPLSERPGAYAKQPLPQVTYAPSITPSTVSYAPSNLAYTPGPASTGYTTIAQRPSSKRNSQQERMYPNDGKYHPYPV
jgi:hypothetical protein